ncbi:hypothetical protein MLD38_015158 [Melastoma candidum]|uniref:Uncharacterized protein n=1 Tax=Melastoma candidum TaxID=119954 RepID=A0ACB9RGK1_9MYRT|nr:hypothetical protein MLD38_015158 [Melastoma candidum]
MANSGDYDPQNHYWDPTMCYPSAADDDIDLYSWVEEAISRCYDSSSPDGAPSSAAPKSVVFERNRRRKLNDRLYALRSVVPNISKMNKVSIIKDAIDYIQEMQEQERTIQREIADLESTGKMKGSPCSCDNDGDLLIVQPYPRSSKKTRTNADAAGGGFYDSAIEVLEIKVTYMGEKTVVVSLMCSKRTHTMVKLCEVFESLQLKVITANISAFSGRLFMTVLVEADEQEKEQLQHKIEAAIERSAYSPTSI